jgi:hypothetical protein
MSKINIEELEVFYKLRAKLADSDLYLAFK